MAPHKQQREGIHPPELFTSIFVSILVCFSWECKYFLPKEETWKVHNDFTKFTLTIQGKLSRKHKGQTLYTVIKLNITGLYCNNYSQHCMHTLIILLNCLQNMPRKSPLPRQQKKIRKKKWTERKKSKFVLFILKTIIFPFPILSLLEKKKNPP